MAEEREFHAQSPGYLFFTCSLQAMAPAVGPEKRPGEIDSDSDRAGRGAPPCPSDRAIPAARGPEPVHRFWSAMTLRISRIVPEHYMGIPKVNGRDQAGYVRRSSRQIRQSRQRPLEMKELRSKAIQNRLHAGSIHLAAQ
jgi:hypothetical protein